MVEQFDRLGIETREQFDIERRLGQIARLIMNPAQLERIAAPAWIGFAIVLALMLFGLWLAGA
jgi:hypothetical protein